MESQIEAGNCGGNRDPAGGGDLSTVYFAPLAGTADEARSIKSLFPEAEVLTGRQATKAALKRVEAPRVLHIATHGFFLDDAGDSANAAPGTRAISAKVDTKNPLLRSGLALAGANLNRNGSDGGILTALEASDLNLWGTKVVTLSACETGIGEVKNFEGVYGLRRAFFLAGARNAVDEPLAGERSRDARDDDFLLHRPQRRAGSRRGAAPGSTGDAKAQRPAAPLLLGQLHPGRRVEKSAR
jgi:hypothetical protein